MIFDTNKSIEYWKEGAKYDLETAEGLLKIERYPYALFMGHLALEKLLKAYVVKATDEPAPKSHNLPYLAQKANLNLPDDIMDRLGEFMEFHLESRYPEEQHSFYRKCTLEYTTNNLDKIKEIFQWLSKKL